MPDDAVEATAKDKSSAAPERDESDAAPMLDGSSQMGDDTASAPDTFAGNDDQPTQGAPEEADTDNAGPGSQSATLERTPDVVEEDPSVTDLKDSSAGSGADGQPDEGAADETSVSGTAAAATGIAPEVVTEPETPRDTASTEARTPPIAPPTPAPAPQKRGGFLPMLLGGVVAGGIGYGIHYYQTNTQPAPSENANALTALETDVAALGAELAELRADAALADDLSDLQGQIAAMEPADLGGVVAEMDELRRQIAAIPRVDEAGLQDQIDALRADPGVDLGPLRDDLDELRAAYAPVPGQVAALQDSMDTLRADMDMLQAEMNALQTLATEEVAQAEDAVDTALVSAGLDRIRAALVTGAPFDEAIAQLVTGGADVPPALGDAADSGVQTVEALQDSYGDAARAAIGASLQSAPADSATEKLGNFFRAQIGARSLAPREGDGADAVTSRAGAAVAEGDLPAALDELSALSDAGRAAMDGWLTAVQTRLDAVAALDALQAEISTE